MRIYVAQQNPIVGDIWGNTKQIIESIQRGREKGAQIVLFSELVLCGYPPDDFLLMPHFIESCEEALSEIASESHGITAIVGTPRRNVSGYGKPLHNSAAILSDGIIRGYTDKMLLPTYDVFDEHRYFEPGVWTGFWDIAGKSIAVTICEDIWRHSGVVSAHLYEEDPLGYIVRENRRPHLVVNLSASPFSVDKPALRLEVAKKAAMALNTPLILCNQVGGNDSLIFDGGSLHLSYRGSLLQQAALFRPDNLLIDLYKPSEEPLKESVDPLGMLHDALVLGVRDYFYKQGFTRACLGLSGGIDSAVVACLAADALGPDNVLGISMPSRYSSEGSVNDARELAHNLGIDFQILEIETVFHSYLQLLGPFMGGETGGITEENLQSRIRGMILMAFCNKYGYILLNTGNKSELAVGYSTLYGDMCGGLAVINDLSKNRVYELGRWFNRRSVVIPQNTLDKEPSAELRPGQKDSDSLPPYDLLDLVVELYLEKHLSPKAIAEHCEVDLALVESIVAAIHRSEYKRRQGPPGLRITQKAFSIGRRFPIVQGWVR